MAEELDDVAIPLMEERIVTSKRMVETGRLKVRTVTEERESVVREQLSRAYVDVERVRLDLEVEEAPPVREEDGVTIIPIVEEVLVVVKKLMVTEEVRIRRRQVVEEHVEPVRLRSQQAVIEREESSGDSVSSNEGVIS